MMESNETPSTRRGQNSGFVAVGNSYKALLIIACIYIARTLMTLHTEIGKDCTEQLADLESFLAVKNSEKREDHLKEKTAEGIAATTEGTAATTETDEDDFISRKKTFESSLPPLSNLTQKSWATQCDEGMVYKTDIIVDNIHDSNRWNKIPKIIHQTSKSRCLTVPFNISTSKWSEWHNYGWSYYFHDDDAVYRMFEMNFENFPLLKDLYESCLVSGTAKADLWRYLVLWQYHSKSPYSRDFLVPGYRGIRVGGIFYH